MTKGPIPGLALLSIWLSMGSAPSLAGSGAAVPQSVPSRRVSNGTWGSRLAGVQVSDSGAVLEFNCARGTIDEPLRLDAAGKFKARGTYVREPADPSAAGDRPESHPAIYAGHLKGTELTFELRLEDTKEVVGTFIVVEGKAPWVPPCH